MAEAQFEHDSDDFVQHQKQMHHANQQLTIHQLTHSNSPLETSASSIRNICTRAQRILKKKNPHQPSQKFSQSTIPIKSLPN